MPAVGGHDILHTAVVPILLGDLHAVDEKVVAVAHVEVGDKGDLVDHGLLDSIGGNASPLHLLLGLSSHEGVALGIDPHEALLLLVVRKEVFGGKVGPAWAVEAQGGIGSLSVGSEEVPPHRRTGTVGLDVDARVQVIGVHTRLGGLPGGGLQQLVGGVGVGVPPEVQEHAVGDGVALPIDDEALVLVRQGVLPVHLTGLSHGVIPHDLQAVAGLGLERLDELLHEDGMVSRQQAVGVALAALGLLVEEPAVKSEILCGFNQLVDDGEIAAGVLLQEVVEPLDLAAVARLGEEHGTQDRHAVAVGRVNDVRTGGNDQALAGGTAPVHQFIDVLPVGEHVGVDGVEAVGRVPAGAGVHDGDSHHIHVLVLGGVGGGELVLGRPLGQGDSADVIGGVRILGRVPAQQVVGEPVGDLGKIGQGLAVGILLRHGYHGIRISIRSGAGIGSRLIGTA